MSKGEVWRDVVGFEGLYKVSNRGNVYSVERRDTIGRKCGGRTLKPSHDKVGYLRVSLSKNGITKQYSIHRLALEAFVPNPKKLPEVNHKDENKANNYVGNLEWSTSKYNSNHGTRNERLSKKVRAVNVITGEVVTFSSTSEAGRKGYNSGGVSQACRGVYNDGRGKLIGDGHTYRGHKWYYMREGE